jgi:hypothetical protein
MFTVGLVVGCYSERATPPTYRYPCSSSEECPQDQSCIDGLCEIPCTTATFEDDCPQNGSFLTCFNGVCASGCDVEDELCPTGLECVDLGLDVSGGGFIGGGSDATIGVCGRMCEAGTTSCPDGEICLQGFCVVTCDPNLAEPICPSGFECTLGVCAPPGLGPMTASATNGGSDTGDATLTTGDATLSDGGTSADGGDTTMGVHDDGVQR